MTDACKKRMAQAVREWLAERSTLTPARQRLINCATYDLLFGPMPAGDEPDGDGYIYPGWDAAADEIRAMDWPHKLYYDDSGEPFCYTEEPTGSEETESLGQGEDEEPDHPDYTPGNADFYVENGVWWRRFYAEPYLDETYELGMREIKRVVLGRDLADNL